jgi:hypothetical protein
MNAIARRLAAIVLSSGLLVACATDGAPTVKVAVAETRLLIEQTMAHAAPGLVYDLAAEAGRSCAFGVGDHGVVVVIALSTDPAFDFAGAARRVHEFWRESGDPRALLHEEALEPPFFRVTGKINEVDYEGALDGGLGIVRLLATSGCYVLGTALDTVTLAVLAIGSLLLVGLTVWLFVRRKRPRFRSE